MSATLEGWTEYAAHAGATEAEYMAGADRLLDADDRAYYGRMGYDALLRAIRAVDAQDRERADSAARKATQDARDTASMAADQDRKRRERNAVRRARHAAAKDLGLVRVRGTGIYE